MDGKEILKQLDEQRAVTDAEKARRASTSRAEAAVEALSSAKEAIIVGNQTARELIASFERLHAMKVGEHPAVVAAGVQQGEGRSDSDSTVFDLGNRAFVSVTKVTSEDPGPTDSRGYGFTLSDSAESLTAASGPSGISLGSISMGETDGFHHMFTPLLNQDGYLRSNLVNLFGTKDNMRTVEQELGLAPLPSISFE